MVLDVTEGGRREWGRRHAQNQRRVKAGCEGYKRFRKRRAEGEV